MTQVMYCFVYHGKTICLLRNLTLLYNIRRFSQIELRKNNEVVFKRTRKHNKKKGRYYVSIKTNKKKLRNRSWSPSLDLIFVIYFTYTFVSLCQKFYLLNKDKLYKFLNLILVFINCRLLRILILSHSKAKNLVVINKISYHYRRHPFIS